ncbi:hypothetical protein GHT07_04855 [Caenimonas koreensis DSM 17982]|uniref:Uncharacterized protein n=2 Tax=Caenimonas TaxID=763439 RepID=A0A844ARB9_9BURK|nr:hypothetical protein [Caenimonas koreensis DSM 17982]
MPQQIVSDAIRRQVDRAGVAETGREAQISEGLMLGAALDYENVLQARLGSATFTVLHLVGHGMLVTFDRARGWKLESSFPFPVILLRESTSASPDASQHLLEAFASADRASFASSFARSAIQQAPHWKESSQRGFNIRVTSSTIHPAAAEKLAAWGIAQNISSAWLGHLTGAAACESLGVPVVPYGETRALGNFTYAFSERLVAQNVRLPTDEDIDLRVQVTLRNVARDIKYRSQLQRWEAMRQVVLDMRVLDDRDDEVVAFRTGYQDDLPDALAQQGDNTPARDAHFFDMAIYRCLQTLFSGIAKSDDALLAKVFVKPDARMRQQIDLFRKKYSRAA